MGDGVGRKSRAPKRSLTIIAAVPQKADGVTPREVDEYLDQLRKDPLLNRDFGSVELTKIERALARDRRSTVAAFTVVCLPGNNPLPKHAPGKKAGKGKK